MMQPNTITGFTSSYRRICIWWRHGLRIWVWCVCDESLWLWRSESHETRRCSMEKRTSLNVGIISVASTTCPIEGICLKHIITIQTAKDFCYWTFVYSYKSGLGSRCKHMYYELANEDMGCYYIMSGARTNLQFIFWLVFLCNSHLKWTEKF